MTFKKKDSIFGLQDQVLVIVKDVTLLHKQMEVRKNQVEQINVCSAI